MPARVLRPLRNHLRGADGGAVTTEMLFVLPVLFTLILLLAQITVWWHAVHIAQATADSALAAARIQSGTATDGRAEAERVLNQLGRGPLRSVHVSVTRGTNDAQVRITGTASSVVPFVRLPVDAKATGPVERFRPAGGTR